MKKAISLIFIAIMIFSCLNVFALEDISDKTNNDEIQQTEEIVIENKEDIQEQAEEANDVTGKDIQSDTSNNVQKEAEESTASETKKEEPTVEELTDESEEETESAPKFEYVQEYVNGISTKYTYTIQDIQNMHKDSKKLRMAAKKTYTTGDTVEYTGTDDNDAGAEFDVDGNPGFCIKPGIKVHEEGKAKITESQNQTLRKVLYKYGYKEKWHKKSGRDNDHTGMMWHLSLQAVTQYAAADTDEEREYVVSVWQSGRGGNWKDFQVKAFKEYVKDAKDVKVPDNFKVFECHDTKSGYQPFAFWVFQDDEINITINKEIGNTAVSSGNGLYGVAGTVFKLYKSAADAKSNSNAVATFTIERNGKSNTVKVNPGTYYIVETKAGAGLLIPNGLKASSGGTAVTVDKTKTINL